jgi:hypothetical protein
VEGAEGQERRAQHLLVAVALLTQELGPVGAIPLNSGTGHLAGGLRRQAERSRTGERKN